MTWLNDKEWRIVFWVMLAIMLLFLTYSIVKLKEEGAIEFCVADNSSGYMNVTCYEERWIAQIQADSINKAKNLDYKYINNYTNLTI